jgi:subtilisin family serine protease
MPSPMKSLFRVVVYGVFCLFGFSVFSQDVQQGVIRVKFKPSYVDRIQRQSLQNGKFGLADADVVSSQIGVKSIKRVFREAGKFEKAHRQFGLHLWYEITFDKNIAVATALRSYGKLPEFDVVESVRPYYAVEPVDVKVQSSPSQNSLAGPTNDPQFGQQWHYENTGQSGGTPGADISLPQAWAVQTGSQDVIVAVIDGGIDVAHPDLTASMWINEDEIAGNSIDDDSNGYVDDVYGYGFGDNTGTIFPHYHGTHVGGTIAAVTNNGVGVSGIAGGSGTGNGVRLMSLAGFGAIGVGGFEDAMVYAADNGAVISQNSWGGGGQSIEAGIDYFVARAGLDNTDANFDDDIQIGPMAGGIVIFAAGNSNTDNTSVGYPASYPPVVAVASTDHSDVKSYFSNYGSWVDIAAPGSNVYSTYPVGLGGYAYLSGTSMACPHVSGVAALIISEFNASGFVPSQVWDRLQMTADNIDHLNPVYEDKLGAGRVNAFQALQTDDDIPPATISNLASAEEKLNSVMLEWTAPGASGTEGVASYYEIRYSITPITSANFGAATLVTNPPKPKIAGSTETFEVKNLIHNKLYYFALKARDFFGNTSGISNVISATTLQPPVIQVTPTSLEESLFTGSSVTRNLTIENNGLSDLFIEISSQKNSSSSSSSISGYADAQRVNPTVVELKNAPSIQGSALSTTSKIYPSLPARPSELQASRSLQVIPPAPSTFTGRLFVLNHSSGQIDELNTSTGAVTKSITPPEPLSGGPDGLAFDGTYIYYISGWGSNDIHKIDASNGDLVSSLNLSSLPYIDGLAHSGEFVYAMDYSNSVIYEINFDEGEIVRTIDPPVSIAGGLSFGGSRGTIFVSNFGSGIYEINLETGIVENTLSSPGTVYGLGYSEALGVLFVSNVTTLTADALDPDSGEILFSLSSVLSAAMGSDEGGNNWLSPDRSITVVEPGDAVIVPVLLDADGLIGGTYEGDVIITSNDPLSPMVEIPVSLHVTGAPNIDTDETTVAFSIGYVNATSKYDLQVNNTGTDVLHVSSFSVSGLPFSVTTEAISIDPGESGEIEISFSPTAVGTYSGTIAIFSDDPDDASFDLPISAEAKLPPEIEVTPSSITESLFTGESVTKQLTIANSGSTALEWTLAIESAAEPASILDHEQPFTPLQSNQAGLNNHDEPVSSAVSGGPFLLAPGDFTTRANSPMRLTCIATDPGTGKIYGQENAGSRYYQFDPYTNVWTTLTSSPLSSGNNGGAVFVNGKIYTMYIENSSTMAIYDVAANSWTTTSNALLAGTANLSTDGTYVYAVTGQNFKRYDPLDNTWTTLAAPPFYFQPWGGLSYKNQTLYGHQGNGYSGFAKYNIASNTWNTLPNVPGGTVLGSAIDPVANKYYAYGNYNGTNFYAYDIAGNEWSISTIPFFMIHDGGMAYVGRPGVSGIYFVQGENGTGFAMFESATTWITTNLASGSIAAGDDEVVNVVLDASGLFGGAYSATLHIESNDPFTPEVDVPVTLTVTGAADIEASVTEIDFGANYVGEVIEKTILVKNLGTDDLAVGALVITGTAFSTPTAPFTVAPGETKNVFVKFMPLTTGAFTGSLELQSNDPNEASVVISLEGSAQLPPEINITPSSFTESLFTGESVTRTLSIQNSGSTPLSWSIELVDGESPTTSDAPQFEAPNTILTGVNNNSIEVTSALSQGLFPLATGDFTSKASSPGALTAITTDPTTGLIYAQANNGYAFYSYDPQTNAWTTLATCPLYSGNNGAATFLNGKIYTIYTGNASTLGVYTVSTNTWSTMSSGMAIGSGNMTTDGTYLYAATLNVFKRYDPVANSWASMSAPPFLFEGWGGLAFDEGVIYGHQGNGTTGFAKYVVATNTWTALPSVPGGAVLGAAIDPTSDIYYTYGSYGGQNWYAFNMATNSWSVTTIPMFNVNDGGLAFVGKSGVSGIYFAQGESGTGFARFETPPLLKWLRVDPLSGEATIGATQQLDVVIDSDGLIGGEYTASIVVLSNDPDEEETIIPVTLTVTGAANIESNYTDIDFPALPVASELDTVITISNNGTDDLIVTSIESNETSFTANVSSFTLDPGDDKEIIIRFKPDAVGPITGSLTFHTNDPNAVEYVITLSGTGVTPSDINLVPGSYTLSLYSGESTTQNLTIENLGGSPLEYQLSFVPDVITPSSVPQRLFEQKSQALYGINNQSQSVNSSVASNVYPLAPGDFTQKANSPAPLTCITADPTADKLYAQADQGYAFYSYSPSTNTWTELAASPLHSGNNGGAAVLNGKVYTVTTGNPSTIGVYTIASNTWTTISNGIAGGTSNITTDGVFLYLIKDYTFKKYNPANNQWTDLPSPPMQFTQWGGLAYDAPFIYGHQGNSLSGFAKFNTATSVWTTLPSLPGGAVLGASIDPSSGKYYAYGSYGGSNWYSFDIAAGTWSVATIPFFTINDGGLAFIGAPGVSGVYFVQGESHLGFARFETDPFSSWLSLSNDSGVIAANEDDDIGVTVNATGLPGGVYTGTISILSNDPAQPESSIPVTLTVTGVADITVTPESLNFESYYIGSIADSTIVISNEGSEDLIISGVTSSHPRFVVTDEEITIHPGAQHSLNVRFIPNIVGQHSGTITLNTNDPNEGTVAISVTGIGVKAPFMVSPSSFSISQPTGTQSSRGLEVSNESNSSMTWSMTIQGQGEFTLEEVLTGIQGGYASITAKIPSKFDFSEGTSGPGIIDGGSDMYDGGNYITTSASSDFLFYTNGTIVDDLDFGLEGRYFTAKYPGLFVLAADADVTSFTIDGDLGADGSGSLDATVLTSYQNGKTYKGFVKRVYNTGDPSVNHLIIVENNGTVSHTYGSSTNSDFHKIESLSGTKRIYYLLFAGTTGSYIPNSSMQEIMDALLALVGNAPEWLSVTKASGSLTVDQKETIQVKVNTNGLEEGMYNASLVARDGNPTHLPFIIPVALSVGTAPDIEPNKTLIDFESILADQSKSSSVTIRNMGTQSLAIASITSTNPTFSVSPASATLAPGDSIKLDVVFSSGTAGDHSGFIKLESNDPDESSLLVDLKGAVSSPARAEVTPADRSIMVYRGRTKIIPFVLKNIGGATMTWSMSGLPVWASLDYTSGSILSGQERTLNLTVNATTLSAADHSVNISLTYNHPVNPTETIPFTIKVKQNHAPELVANIPLHTIVIGDSTSFSLAQFFTDDDGDLLKYEVTNNDPAFVTTFLENGTLTLTSVAIGSGIIQVKVVDAADEFILTTFAFVIRPVNLPPTWRIVIPNQFLETSDGSISFNLAEYSFDDDDDVLRFSVDNPGPSVVTAGIVGSVLTIDPVSDGHITLTVFAEDPDHEKAEFSFDVFVELTTGLDDVHVLKEITCSPNPFTGMITFDYALDRPGKVRLTILDLTGREQSTVIDAHQPAGRKSLMFDGSNMNSGMYFYRLEFEGEMVVTKKLIRQ